MPYMFLAIAILFSVSSSAKNIRQNKIKLSSLQTIPKFKRMVCAHPSYVSRKLKAKQREFLSSSHLDSVVDCTRHWGLKATVMQMLLDATIDRKILLTDSIELHISFIKMITYLYLWGH